MNLKNGFTVNKTQENQQQQKNQHINNETQQNKTHKR